MAKSLLTSLRAHGFDESRRVEGGAYQACCSQCEALVINGHPTHEEGCPHAVHACAGCNALVPIRQEYCLDCDGSA